MSNTRILPLFGGGGGGEQGVQGIQGIQGPAGSGGGGTGIQGLQGIQGIAGSDGLNGQDGLQGVQGIAGSDGLNGQDGAQGIQGIAGSDGLQGADGIQGYVGLQGATGETGAQGVQGIAGSDGLNGQDGAQGIQGIAGEMGLQGADGFGLQGVQGIVGLQGPAGSGSGSDITYINNFTQEQLVDFYNNYILGDIIDYLPLYVDTFPVVEHFSKGVEVEGEEVDVVYLGYEPYVDNEQTDTNYIGLSYFLVYPDGTTNNYSVEAELVTVTGLQNALQDISGGIQGVQGAMGLQGETGAQGATGANGADGLQGYIGIQGAAGSNGIDGLQGYTGAQGADGKDGIDGLQGYIGIQGFEGIQGFTGETGEQGVQGIAGSNGADGLQGYTGFQGIQGADGGAGMERVDLLEMDTQELIDFHDDYIAEMATIDDLWYGQYKVVGAEAVTPQEGNRNTRSVILWVYLYLSPWVSDGNNPNDLTQPYVVLKPDGSLEETGLKVDLDSGGGTPDKYDLATLNQQDLADFYDDFINNDESIWRENLVYVDGYPVTDIGTYIEQVDDGEGNMEDATVVYVFYDTFVDFDFDGDYPRPVEDSEKQYINSSVLKIYEDGTSDFVSSSNEFVTVLGLQNALQDISGGQGLQGIQGTDGLQGYIGIQGINGADGLQGYIGIQGTTGIQGSDGNVSSNTVELQFILEDNTMVNYEVYIRQ